MPGQGNNIITNSKQFEALFNYATVGIIVTDEKGDIINFNKQAEKDFGYTKEEILKNSVDILLPPAVRAKHKVYRDDFYEHPSPREMGHGRHLFAQKKDGSVFPVEVSLSNYTIDAKLFVIAFVIDIAVRKEQELVVLKQKEELERITAEIRQLNTGLEKKVEDRTRMLRETLSALEQSKLELSDALKAEKDLGELKSRFVSMASHEFKTPLSTILSSAFLLEKYNGLNEPLKRIKHVERIKNAVGDMKNILNDLLSLDKLEEGLIKSDMQIVTVADCNAAIQNVIDKMEINLKDGQQISYAFDGNEPVVLDKHLLKNICTNLISNAIKFSPENKVIRITSYFDKDGFKLSVEDSGIGISEEDQQHLFERFFRAKNAFNIQGTGLGLHIVGKYLDLMNGNIELKSELDSGSVFTIYIPAK